MNFYSCLYILAGLAVEEIAGEHSGNRLQETVARFDKSDGLVVPDDVAIAGEFQVGIGGGRRGIGAGLNFGTYRMNRRRL